MKDWLYRIASNAYDDWDEHLMIKCLGTCLALPVCIAIQVGVFLVKFIVASDWKGDDGRGWAVCCRSVLLLIVTAAGLGVFAWCTRERIEQQLFDFTEKPDEVTMRASRLLAEVAASRKGVSSTHAELTRLVSHVAVTPTDSEMASEPTWLSIEEMLTLVEKLIEQGELAIELHGNLLKAIEDYSGILPEATNACLRAAANQKKFAAQETYAELKETYLAAAGFFERHAKEIEKSAGAISQPSEDVIQSADYAQHGVEFLKHFRDDLRSIPEFPGDAMQAEVLQAIQSFVKEFEKLRATLDAFGNALPDDRSPNGPTA